MLGIIPTLARWVKVEEVLKSLRRGAVMAKCSMAESNTKPEREKQGDFFVPIDLPTNHTHSSQAGTAKCPIDKPNAEESDQSC